MALAAVLSLVACCGPAAEVPAQAQPPTTSQSPSGPAAPVPPAAGASAERPPASRPPRSTSLPAPPPTTTGPESGTPASPQADTGSSLPAELKIDSQLLAEIHRLQGKPAPPDKTGVKIDAEKRALIDVRAVVTPELTRAVTAHGGTVVSTSARDHSILAWVPLLKIEALAGESAVRAIVPAAQSIIK